MAFVPCLIFIAAGVILACCNFGAIAYVLLCIGMAPVVGLFYNMAHQRKYHNLIYLTMPKAVPTELRAAFFVCVLKKRLRYGKKEQT